MLRNTLQTKSLLKRRFEAARALLTPLLDGEEDVAFAGSVRKLSSTYNGACMRILRTDLVTPTEHDIGFVDNYLDTASLLTIANGNKCLVKTLYDQIGS